MKVFIPAAGLGTRLKPLTDDRPKALVAYQGKPLLAHLLERLQAQGFSRFVLNLHHFAPMLRSYAEGYARQHNISIEFSDESFRLLDTGGALTHALPLFRASGDEAVLVHNVDVFSDLDLRRFVRDFENLGVDALLSVRRRETSRYLLAGADGALCGWKNVRTGEVKGVGAPSAGEGTPSAGEGTRAGGPRAIGARAIEAFAFSGIHILRTHLIEQWAGGYGTDIPFSVIDAYIKAVTGSPAKKILLQEQKEGFWRDMGKVEDFF